jgi:hypothetical protein
MEASSVRVLFETGMKGAHPALKKNLGLKHHLINGYIK